MSFDGKDFLGKVLVGELRYNSVAEAIASLTLFAHPKTVQQTKNKNIFRVIRDFSSRGKIIPDGNGGQVLACDNQTPIYAFCWASQCSRGNDLQFNHVYTNSRNVEIYTSLANLCVTPAFLAKLTDKDENIKALLRYRSYDLYGFLPDGTAPPTKPSGYEGLKWMEHPDPVDDIELVYRKKMKDCPGSRASLSARELGWLFSGFEPDPSV